MQLSYGSMRGTIVEVELTIVKRSERGGRVLGQHRSAGRRESTIDI